MRLAAEREGRCLGSSRARQASQRLGGNLKQAQQSSEEGARAWQARARPGEEQDDWSGSLLPGRLMETAGTVTLETAKCSWTAVLKTWPCGSNVGLTAEAKTVLLVSLMRKTWERASSANVIVRETLLCAVTCTR